MYDVEALKVLVAQANIHWLPCKTNYNFNDLSFNYLVTFSVQSSFSTTYDSGGHFEEAD